MDIPRPGAARKSRVRLFIIFSAVLILAIFGILGVSNVKPEKQQATIERTTTAADYGLKVERIVIMDYYAYVVTDREGNKHLIYKNTTTPIK